MADIMTPRKQELVDRAEEFLKRIEYLTPGPDLQNLLNREHGPGTPFYDDFATLLREGLNEEDWVAKRSDRWQEIST